MQPQANCCSDAVATGLSSFGEPSTEAMLAALAAHGEKSLVFVYDGREVLPGYHVTEVKAGSFVSLDCGANPESWRETFIQLWDVQAEQGRGFMPVGKFLAIIKKVADKVAFNGDARLTFEVSDGQSAMQMFALSSVEVDVHAVRLTLRPRPASCKPRDRWLEQRAAAQPDASAPAMNATACCS